MKIKKITAFELEDCCIVVNEELARKRTLKNEQFSAINGLLLKEDYRDDLAEELTNLMLENRDFLADILFLKEEDVEIIEDTPAT